MSYPNLRRKLGTSTIILGVLVGLSHLSLAQSIKPSLTASLASKSKVTGQASYFEMKNESVFAVGIENSSPKTALLVVVQRGKAFQKIAWFNTDQHGRGGVKISSQNFKIPRLQPGDRIQVWSSKYLVAFGQFGVFK